MRCILAILSSIVVFGASLAPSAIVNLGVENNSLNAVATDSSGNFYIAGSANNKILVVKVSPAGEILYSRVFGGSVNDTPSGIAVDTSGAAYVVGNTNSSDFPIVNGYLTLGNMFLTKLSPDGSTIVYSTYVAADGLGGVRSVAVDAAGNAYVTGSAEWPSVSPTGSGKWPGFITTPGAFMTNADVPMYRQSVFVVKVAPDGSKPVWATFIAGNGIACATLPGVTCPISTPGFQFAAAERDVGAAIAVDAAGHAYVAGWTNSAGFPVTPGTVQTTYADPFGIESQGFVTKLSADGSSLVYSTYIGNAQGELLWSLAVDSEGNAIAGGTAMQIPLTPKPGWPASPLPPIKGGFVVKLDPQASSFAYAKSLGDGTVTGIAASGNGNVYAIGSFFAMLDGSGSPVYSTSFPEGDIGGNAIALGSPSSVAIAGPNVLTIFGPADPSQPAAYALANAALANGFGTNPTAKVAPGELLYVYGANFGASATVTFDGVQAPVFATQANQILIQAPFEIAGRDSTVMRVDDGPQLLSLAVVPQDPAIFSQALNGDGTLNSSNNPAHLGSIMTVFVAGAGPWRGELGTGEYAPLTPFFSPQSQVSVQVSASNQDPVHQATVLYAGSAPTESDGMMAINFQLPISAELKANSLAWVTVQVGTTLSPATLVYVTN